MGMTAGLASRRVGGIMRLVEANSLQGYSYCLKIG